MIDWDEVKVGETEIVGPSESHYVIVGRHADYVWVYSTLNDHNFTRPFAYFEDWTIYDPWEDVSEECTISPYGTVMYDGAVISFFDFQSGKFKRSEKGLRVWKRKEG